MRIGTRSSPLALAQTDMVIAALRERAPALAAEADSRQGDLA
ncbi:hypothetical protein [Kitasatospora sp. NA04385]